MSQFWNGEVLAAPNLITVCVDESQASEISGRLYHGYSQEPQSFENVVQLAQEPMPMAVTQQAQPPETVMHRAQMPQVEPAMADRAM